MQKFFTSENANNYQLLEELFIELWNGIPDAVLLVDENGIIRKVNKKLYNLFGYQQNEIVGCQIENLIPSRFTNHTSLFKRYMEQPKERKERALPMGLFGLKKGNIEFPVDVNLKPIIRNDKIYVLTFVRDLSDRVKAEKEKKNLLKQLYQSQKIQAIGQLTSGIAHDFNNILGIMSGYIELIQDKNTASNPKLTQYINHIASTCNHGRDLIMGIQRFERKDKLKKKVLAINPVIEETLKILSSILPATIIIQSEIEQNLPCLKYDPTQIKQVIINMFINARDAMPQGGNIFMSMALKKISDYDCISCHESFSGEYVELKITDTGTGISDKNLRNIFKSMFTTKEPDKGTGIGLSVVNSIIHEHAGHIQVESALQKGTAFMLYLPANNFQKVVE